MKLNGKIVLEGIGLHSGKTCRAVLEPSASPEVLLNGYPLRELALNGTNRGSDYISPDGSRVRTCEHVFSALAGLGFWSGVSITVKGGEMPALDGCSRALCDELRRHSEQNALPEPVNVKEYFLVAGDKENTTRFIVVLPSDDFRITYMVKYKFIGEQVFSYTGDCDYYEEISQARTFAMQRDIDYLRSHGMALGGSLDNAIVVGETVQAKGGLHWPDEFVRHKVLDIIGDLAAVGRPVNAHIIAVRAGHELHLKLAEKLRGEYING